MVNATAAALLGLLRERPHTGYALVQSAQAVLGDFWTVTRSQVYRELAAMADRGLVEGDEAGARDARPYRLTDAGQAAFTEWLHSGAGTEVVRIPLLLRLAFVDAVDRDWLLATVREQRAEHEARLAGYRQSWSGLVDGCPPEQLLTLRFGLRYEQAVLAWFDEVEDVLGRD